MSFWEHEIQEKVEPVADSFFRASPPADQLLMFFAGSAFGFFGVAVLWIWLTVN